MQITGHITIVQEERIRLIGDDGRAYLLTLAHNADTESPTELQSRKDHVLVDFEGEPDLDSGVVHRIRRIPNSEFTLPEFMIDSQVLSEASVL